MRSCVISIIFSLLLICSGCQSAPAVLPSFTLNVTDTLSKTEKPFETVSSGRVVVAEVFTYDD
jgi:hypothetical protein